MKRRTLFILYFLLGIARPASTQESYSFELAVSGISGRLGPIQSVFQDSLGTIWIGQTGRPLLTYDGQKFVPFPLEELNGGKSVPYFSAGAGKMFFHAGHQLLPFDPVKQEMGKPIEVELGKDSITGIHQAVIVPTPAGYNIWAIAPKKEAGPYLARQERSYPFYLLKSENGGPLKPVMELTTFRTFVLANRKGRLLVKVDGSLLELDERGKELAQYPLVSRNLNKVVVDEDGTLWLHHQDSNCGKQPGACDNWVLREGERSFQREELPVKTAWEDIYATFREGDNLWKAGTAFRLYRFDIKAKKRYDYTAQVKSLKGLDALKSNIITDIFQDKTGALWLVIGSGLVRIQKSSEGVSHYLQTAPSCVFQNNTCSMRGIAEGRDGTMYFSYYNGIHALNPKDGNLYPLLSNVEQGLGLFSLNLKNDKLYSSSFSIDLKTRTAKRLHHYLAECSNMIDSDGRLWLKNNYNNELLIFDTANDSLLLETRFPFSPATNHLYQSPSTGAVWLATENMGILQINQRGQVLKHFTDVGPSAIRLFSNDVKVLFEDGEGILWVGYNNGLGRIDFKAGSSDLFEVVAGNPFRNEVYGILPEDERYLWLSTNKGVFRFDKNTGTASGFPLHPGLSDAEFNRSSAFKASDGRMYFGSLAGVFAFYPNEIVAQYEGEVFARTFIVLSKFEKFDGQLDQLVTQTRGLQQIETIELAHNDRFFGLEFVLNDFRKPDEVLYSFFLEGFQKDWTAPVRFNRAQYDNLPAGKYTLRVRAGLTPAALLSNERQIDIVVRRAWYKTWWAYVLYLLAIGGGILAARHYELRRKLAALEARRLRDLDHLKTRLYTNITHEFRTPLTVIMGLNDNIRGFEQERRLIRRNSKNLLRLINQLLDLSKLDFGAMKMDTVQGDIISYLQYLTESFHSMATEKKVSLVFLPEAQELVMDFDEVKMQHMMYNLLSNAIKFTKPGGKVKVLAAKKQRNNQPHLQVKVEDTGTGISQKDLPHIFERFYQASPLPPPKEGVTWEAGTGIGLALTKELVELTGGKISVVSEENAGTVFTILLPARKEASTLQLEKFAPAYYSENELVPGLETPAPENGNANQDLPRLLVVEDNDGVITYIRSLLEKNYLLAVAKDGAQGIEMAFEQVPDLIITDVMMPEKDGYEVCRTLKNDERTSHIPIIMLTAKADLPSKLEGFETGADAYLTKPFEKKELFMRIRKLMELREKLKAYYSRKGADPVPKNILPKRESAFLQKLRDFIETHLDDPDLGIEHLCSEAHLSNTQVFRKLKALTGKSPSQFIRSIRLHKGMELLKSSDRTISEIAYDMGFNDPNYFSRTFKLEFGKTPAEVRGE